MRFSQKLVLGLTIILALGLILSGCGKSGGNAQDKPSEGGAKEVIKIGASFELSGPGASYGSAELNGAKMAVEKINKAGGILGKEIKLVDVDNKTDAAESINVATKLITNDKVVAIIGPATSGATIALAPITEKYKVPVVSPSGTAVDVTVDSQNNNKVRPYIFRACFLDSFQGRVTAEFAVDELKAKNAAILVNTGSDYSKGLAKVFKETIESKGGKVVAEVGYLDKDPDFRAVLTKVRGASPDVVYVPDYYDAVGKLIKQARELKIEVPILGNDGWDSPKLVEIAGAANANNTFFSNHFTVEDPDPAVQEFVKAYEAQYKQKPDAFAALGYDTMLMVAEAIKNANSTEPEKIKDALEKTKDFKGVTGTLSMDENHNPVKSAVMIELKDGKQTVKKKVQ